jgi:uracil-DNA glycosylase
MVESNMQMRSFSTVLTAVRNCTICQNLPLGPKPILQFDPQAKILIAGQAPGSITHQKGIPFDDPSGNRLREWMGIDRKTFYDKTRIAIIPMALCFPGSGKNGDLPPPTECAQNWREKLLAHLPNIQLTLVLGKYALDWHLGDRQAKTLTETVKQWRNHKSGIIPMPHPSPRNNRWLKNNPWFSQDVLPNVRARVSSLL